MEALGPRQAGATAGEQPAPTPLQNLHRAVSPAEALFLEIKEGVRIQSAPIASRDVNRRTALLEEFQAEAMARASDAVPIATGENSYRVSVNMSFAID